MRSPEKPTNEAQRLEVLRSLGILDTHADERFDRVTRLAQQMFQVPIAVVSLVDVDRQWFKSCLGLDATETPREISFCGHAILEDGLFVVADALRDDRFADNPLVAGDPNIRFYAGFPLEVLDGCKLGTLCLIDQEPRELSEEQRSMLRDLGEIIQRELSTLALATRDELTGLVNRRGFSNVATKVFSLCRRLPRPALLLYFDLDGFKAINDELGHAEGDRALTEFAGILRDVFRDSDVVARLGGDEFCVFLSGTETSGEAVERLQARIAQRNDDPGEPFQLSYSVGAVHLDPRRHETIDDLIQEADVLMFAAKKSD